MFYIKLTRFLAVLGLWAYMCGEPRAEDSHPGQVAPEPSAEASSLEAVAPAPDFHVDEPATTHFAGPFGLSDCHPRGPCLGSGVGDWLGYYGSDCPQPCLPPCLPQGRGRLKAIKQYCYWGYPEEFCERPFGSWMRAQMNTHIVNGLVAQLALYQYDFQNCECNPAILSRRGHVQLQKIANILVCHCLPVLVEGSGDSELDQARRRHVFEQLGLLNCPISEDQIVVGTPETGPLSGVEAALMYGNQLQQTRSRGGTLGGPRATRSTTTSSSFETGSP